MAHGNGLVLADDATGALECASLLAGLGVRVSISLTGDVVDGVQVVDTESRHLPADAAAARIGEWLRGAPEHVFKKTDSTLRGNIAAELLTMLEYAGGRHIVYSPAYPALGRTVVNGQLLVDGVPVAETEFAADAREPVRTSGIIDLFPPGSRGQIVSVADARALPAALEWSDPRILICGAASNGDLDTIATVLRQTTAKIWVAGPAAFIGAWASLANFPKAELPLPLRARKWLIVCGSRHPQSRRQARIAGEVGLAVIQSSDRTSESADLAATELASRTIEFIRAERPDALLIMGGDTVRAVWRAMNVQSLTALPEVLPGIAACRSREPEMLFVTKAGGFGDDRLVEKILDRCNRT